MDMSMISQILRWLMRIRTGIPRSQASRPDRIKRWYQLFDPFCLITCRAFSITRIQIQAHSAGEWWHSRSWWGESCVDKLDSVRLKRWEELYPDNVKAQATISTRVFVNPVFFPPNDICRGFLKWFTQIIGISSLVRLSSICRWILDDCSPRMGIEFMRFKIAATY